MKLFVTGGTGFLGSHLLNELKANLGPTDVVYVLCRSPRTFDDSRFQAVVGDFKGIASARTELLASDYVFHIGGEARFGNDLDYQGSNIQPTREMLDILKGSSTLKNFIFTSTIGAFDREPSDRIKDGISIHSRPNPTSKYGKSKLECEQMITSSGLPFTIVRPTWIWGKGMRLDSHVNAFVSLVIKLPLMARLGFPGKVSLIYVEDMARALANCINNASVVNRCYFGVTENASIGTILNMISRRLSGREISQIPIPSFHFLLSRIHKKLPLALANLFLNYLTAQDEAFAKDFGINAPVVLSNALDSVIENNPNAHGVYLITGANSGIGLAVAKSLRKQKKPLVLVDRNIDRLAPFVGDTVIEADLSDAAARTKIVKIVSQMPLRCLMNIAGVGFRGGFFDVEAESVSKTVDVNATGTLLLTHSLRKKLVADHSDIVNIASSVAYYPLPGMAVYAASKAFIASWSEALAVELKRTNRVFTISPGGTKTNFQTSAGVKATGDLLSPDAVSARILKTVAGKGKPKTAVYGTKANVLFVMVRILPQRVIAKIMGRLFSEAR